MVEPGHVTCVQGDSGGPLVAQDEAGHGWSVVGLTSWGPGPGQCLVSCFNDMYNFIFI